MLTTNERKFQIDIVTQTRLRKQNVTKIIWSQKTIKISEIPKVRKLKQSLIFWMKTQESATPQNF